MVVVVTMMMVVVTTMMMVVMVMTMMMTDQHTLRTPTMVVVRAELWLVQKMIEYMRKKPMMHDDMNEIRKPTSNHLSYSIAC